MSRKQRSSTPQETIVILEYLCNSVQKGYPIEKPNAKAYYKKFLDNTTILKDVTPDLVKNKVRNLKSNYIAAIKFKRESGQGVKENDGEITFKQILAKRYPYLNYFKIIWDHRMNVIPPRKNETIQIGPLTPTTTATSDVLSGYNLHTIDEPDKELLDYHEKYLQDDDLNKAKEL